MDRIQQITKHITRQMRGIEIAPWHSPIVPRRNGYDTLVLDVFDNDKLHRRLLDDPELDNAMAANIETVDMVGSAAHIEALVGARGELGTFDYIVSSHNFEHIPNPVKFLQGCSRVLKPGGILSMAIPDKRGCFDYFKPHSTSADVIAAYFENREVPSPTQVFLSKALRATFVGPDGPRITFAQTENPALIAPAQRLEESFAEWRAEKDGATGEYFDTHCWAFTPSSFCLIALELRQLGLTGVDLLEAQATTGSEFFVYLKNTGAAADMPNFTAMRQQLLQNIQNELAENCVGVYHLRTGRRPNA